MFIVCNRIPVNPDHAEAFEATFAARSGLVDQMKGFVSYQLLKPATEGAPYVVMTTWENEADFRAWTESAEFKEGHARSGTLPKETFLGRPTLETFESIQ